MNYANVKIVAEPKIEFCLAFRDRTGNTNMTIIGSMSAVVGSATGLKAWNDSLMCTVWYAVASRPELAMFPSTVE